MSDLEEVHVSAFVPRNNPVTLVEAAELRRLRAENKVLREIATELDEALEGEYGSGRPEEWETWETASRLDARVQAALHGE